MKTEDTKTDDQIVEEAADGLAAPESEEQDDDWSPDDLNEEQRQQYERGVAAVDEFLADKRTTRYEATDENREKLLAYLEQHDLPMSFGGLYVAFEQLSEAGELEFAERNTKDQAADEQPDGQPDASARLATALLARGTKSEEEPPEVEEEPEMAQEEIGRRGRPVRAFRNGRAVIGLGS